MCARRFLLLLIIAVMFVNLLCCVDDLMSISVVDNVYSDY